MLTKIRRFADNHRGIVAIFGALTGIGAFLGSAWFWHEVVYLPGWIAFALALLAVGVNNVALAILFRGADSLSSSAWSEPL